MSSRKIQSSRIMALSASLRATAISATCFGLPTASRRVKGGGQVFRTRGRPAAILRRPRIARLVRVIGQRPRGLGSYAQLRARWHAAGCSRSACTCCSSSAISWLNEAITRSRPKPQRLAVATGVRCWARRPTSASRWRSNSRRSRNCRLGKRVRVAAAHRTAPTPAHRVDRFSPAVPTSERSRGSPRPRSTRRSSAAHTAVSNPPVASKTINCGSKPARLPARSAL